jgi:uncharacterized protein (TIGR02646 family)
MIYVRRTPAPAHLDGPNSPGGKERAKATALYADDANKMEKFPFEEYKHETVKEALNILFHRKCAYCEGVYEKSHAVEVEHFRPKGGFMRGKVLEQPGYYWLAAEWTNLLPACIDCNRERRQKFERGPVRLSGKKNKFPLVDETRRARRPGQERHERPLLLDPCRDHPERHLAFDDAGFVEPVKDRGGRPSPMGEISIEVYGLHRDGVVRGRRTVLMYLKKAMVNVERNSRHVNRHPNDPEADADLEASIRDMMDFAKPKQEYAQACRQAIGRFKKTFI